MKRYDQVKYNYDVAKIFYHLLPYNQYCKKVMIGYVIGSSIFIYNLQNPFYILLSMFITLPLLLNLIKSFYLNKNISNDYLNNLYNQIGKIPTTHCTTLKQKQSINLDIGETDILKQQIQPNSDFLIELMKYPKPLKYHMVEKLYFKHKKIYQQYKRI